MASASFAFEFYEDNSEVPTDPTTFLDVRMAIKNSADQVVLSCRIGEGLTIETDQITGRNFVVLDKKYTENNLPPGSYRYDMLVIQNEDDACIPIKGPFLMIENITE
jgi:hypothetical protein